MALTTTSAMPMVSPRTVLVLGGVHGAAFGERRPRIMIDRTGLCAARVGRYRTGLIPQALAPGNSRPDSFGSILPVRAVR